MRDYLAPGEVRTPWGNAQRLRERRLTPGPGASRADVARNQRERLFGAMVACVAERGYAATTVGDVVALAGVSRATFYAHFDDKGHCFRATAEELLEIGLAKIRRALAGRDPWQPRGERALATLLKLAAEQPVAARICLVEAYAAGCDGLEPVHRALGEGAELTYEALRGLPGRSQTRPELAVAIVGGLHRVIYQRLAAGDHASLPALAPELSRWARCYPPLGPLPPARRRARGTRPPSEGGDPLVRTLRGFATAVAKRGLSRTTISQIAGEASISQETFYREFSGKDDVLAAALDASGAQILAAALPAARRAPDWPRALRRALETVCAFLAAEPAFARLRAIEVYAAGPWAIEQRDDVWRQLLAQLVPADLRSGSDPGKATMDAISGAIYALVYERVRAGEADRLPELTPLLTYIALSPLIGPARSREVATGTGPRARGRR
jgi:AcrR family transcriptional regulator